MAHKAAENLPCLQIPQAHGLIGRAGEDITTICAERHTECTGALTVQPCHQFAGLNIPYADPCIVSTSQDTFAIGTEHRAKDLRVMVSPERLERLVCGQAPALKGSGSGAIKRLATIRPEGYAIPPIR